MYGAITGKIAVTVVILLLCVARVAMLIYNRQRAQQGTGEIVSLVVQISIPLLVAVLVWKVLWY
ncbi:hypothetical protein [Saccharibacter floricola]|uniref:HIG1 domain-containing protein n=1 Tax=Saccharibacter floricola DSM 15669 TaxID=1123227 RepID=A0ABQ0P064_9PROT|nr:hypothetical protein [Saccharibacter floricola]GBQ07950.1 hypothetical protein AA15669_1600 [Saccharibacter floricola DSM 15669]